MRFKFFFCLVLGLSGSLSSCCTSRPGVLAKNAIPAEEGVLNGLGSGFSIRLEANSWLGLLQKVKPAFEWNGRDLLWIENNPLGEPQFLLDEAYLYQPTNYIHRWVLIKDERTESNLSVWPSEGWWRQFGNQYLRAVINLQPSKPEPNDGDVLGNYAVVKSANQKYGVVYELGWQSEMSDGNAHPAYGRRIYLFRDLKHRWHFVGEGPEERAEHGGGSTVASTVDWHYGKSKELPFQIQFKQISWISPGGYSSEDTNRPPDVVKTNDYILAEKFPAQFYEENLP